MNVKKSDILTTNSVNSYVKAEGERIGHVVLCDYDADGGELAADVESLEGLTLVLESSENRYHLWNLSIRDLDETALTMLELHGDATHIPPGYRRGFWRIRSTPKKRPSSDIYKDAPVLKSASWNDTAVPQSLPHYRVAQVLFGLKPLPEGTGYFVGDALSTTEYLTMTDELKNEL